MQMYSLFEGVQSDSVLLLSYESSITKRKAKEAKIQEDNVTQWESQASKTQTKVSCGEKSLLSARAHSLRPLRPPFLLVQS